MSSFYNKQQWPAQARLQAEADPINAAHPNDAHARYVAAARMWAGRTGGESAWECRLFGHMLRLSPSQIFELGEVRCGRRPKP